MKLSQQNIGGFNWSALIHLNRAFHQTVLWFHCFALLSLCEVQVTKYFQAEAQALAN